MSLAKGVFAAAEYAAATIPEHPKLAPWAVPFDIGDGRLQVRGSAASFTLPHPFFAAVFRNIRKYLDGSRSADQIADAARAECDPAAVTFLLKMLAAHGMLVAGFAPRPPNLPERQLGFFQQMDRGAAIALAELESRTVQIVADDPVGKLIHTLLAQAGLSRLKLYGVDAEETSALGEFRSEGICDPPDLMLVVAGGLSDRVLMAANEHCLKTGGRWLSASIGGPQARVGPTFIPTHTACYTCFKHRLNCNSTNLAADRAFEATVAGGHPDQGSLDAFTHMIAGNLVLEALRLLTGVPEPATIGRYFWFDAKNPKCESHDVLRVPRCAACGRSRIIRRAWDWEPEAGGEGL